MPRINHVRTDSKSWSADQHAINPRAPHQSDLLNRFADLQVEMSRCTLDYLYLLRNVCALYPSRVQDLFGGTITPADIQCIGQMSHLDLIDLSKSTAPFFSIDPVDIARVLERADPMESLRTVF